MKALKSISLYLIFTFVLLIGVEVFLRYWTATHLDALQRARVILTFDSVLGWRQKENLDTEFETKKIITNTNGFRSDVDVENKKIDVLTLGPSSAFGWGVNQNETYTELLHQKNKYEVLNASGIGYTIVQGRKLFDRLIDVQKIKPRVVIVSYGINELDRFRFFGESKKTDSEYFNQKLIADWKDFSLLSTLSFFQLLFRAYQEINFLTECGPQEVLASRVSLADFESELKRLIQKSKDLGIYLIFMSTAFHANMSAEKNKPDQSDFLYQKSIESTKAQDCKNAKMFFYEARQYEAARITHQVAVLNSALEKTALDNHLSYVDNQKVLSDADKDQNYFDPVHPSALGHQKLYNELIKTITAESLLK